MENVANEKKKENSCSLWGFKIVFRFEYNGHKNAEMFIDDATHTYTFLTYRHNHNNKKKNI